MMPSTGAKKVQMMCDAGIVLIKGIVGKSDDEIKELKKTQNLPSGGTMFLAQEPVQTRLWTTKGSQSLFIAL